MSKKRKLSKKNKDFDKEKSNPQLKKDSPKNNPTFIQKVSRFIRQPFNLVLLKFCVLMGLFYLIWVMPFFQENFVKYVGLAYAKVTGVFLQTIQVPVKVIGDSIGNSDFMVSIRNGCDGLEAMAILLFAILVYPTSWSNRLKGFAIGFMLLILLNFIRIISLYFIGTYVPSIFDIMHLSIWQAIFIIVPLLIIAQWISWIKNDNLKVA